MTSQMTFFTNSNSFVENKTHWLGIRDILRNVVRLMIIYLSIFLWNSYFLNLPFFWVFSKATFSLGSANCFSPINAQRNRQRLQHSETLVILSQFKKNVSLNWLFIKLMSSKILFEIVKVNELGCYYTIFWPAGY